MTIDGLLRPAPIDALEARILIAHALQCSRVQLVTRSQDELSAQDVDNIHALFNRRKNGEPIAYITGEREFFGLRFFVTPDVLIPRPETELLVELSASHLPQHGSLLDLGTGSGAIAVALASVRKDAVVSATDISLAALEVAKKNAAAHRVAINFMHSDWTASVSGKFDLIVSNPPYIEAGDPHLSAGDLRFEPVDALTDHGHGLTAIQAIIDGAPAHLHAGGWLLLEHGYDQAAAVHAYFHKNGWESIQSWPDLAGILRVTGAQRHEK